MRTTVGSEENPEPSGPGLVQEGEHMSLKQRPFGLNREPRGQRVQGGSAPPTCWTVFSVDALVAAARSAVSIKAAAPLSQTCRVITRV